MPRHKIKSLSKEDYQEAINLEGKSFRVKYHAIQKKRHKLFIKLCDKRALSIFETKRHWGPPHTHPLDSVPFGYEPSS